MKIKNVYSVTTGLIQTERAANVKLVQLLRLEKCLDEQLVANVAE